MKLSYALLVALALLAPGHAAAKDKATTSCTSTTTGSGTTHTTCGTTTCTSYTTGSGTTHTRCSTRH